jgi:hypothetical protein
LPDTVEIEIVSNSGHIIQTDNFAELAERIINFSLREEKTKQTDGEIDEIKSLELKGDKFVEEKEIKEKSGVDT